MDNLPFILLALGCPVGMRLMMLLMGRGMMGMGKHGGGPKPVAGADPENTADPEKRLALLQAQRELIDSQIHAAEQGFETKSAAPNKEA